MKNYTIILCFLILSGITYHAHSIDFLTHTIPLKGEIVETKCLIGQPSRICMVDSFLLMVDPYEGKSMTVINTKNPRQTTRLLTLGDRPGEVIMPYNIVYDDERDELLLFLVQSGTQHIYGIKRGSSLNKLLTYTRSIRFADRPFNVVTCKERVIGIAPYTDGRFHLYDPKGTFITAMGDYPFDGNSLPPEIRFGLYQGHICAQPNGSVFALGGSYSDEMTFYRVVNEQIIPFKEHGTRKALIRFEGRVEVDENCLIGYKGAMATPQYCYMLYSGILQKENLRKGQWAKHVVVFRWDGSFVRSYRFDTEVSAFCVDEKNGAIYGITMRDDKYALVRFPFPDK